MCAALYNTTQSKMASFVAKIFAEFDTDGNGYISSSELHELVVACGLSTLNVHDLLSQIDRNKTGTVNFTDFLEWVTNAEESSNTDQEGSRENNNQHTSQNIVYTALRLRYMQRVVSNSLRQVSREFLDTKHQHKKARVNRAATRISVGDLDPDKTVTFQYTMTPSQDEDWDTLKVPLGCGGALVFAIPICDGVSDFEVGKLAGKLNVILSFLTSSLSIVGNSIQMIGTKANQSTLKSIINGIDTIFGVRLPRNVQEQILTATSILFSNENTMTTPTMPTTSTAMHTEDDDDENNNKANRIIYDTKIQYPCYSSPTDSKPKGQKNMNISIYFGDIASRPFEYLSSLGFDLKSFIHQISITHRFNRIFKHVHKNKENMETTKEEEKEEAEERGEQKQVQLETKEVHEGTENISESLHKSFISNIGYVFDFNCEIEKNGINIFDDFFTNMMSKFEQAASSTNSKRRDNRYNMNHAVLQIKQLILRLIPLILRMTKLSKLQISFSNVQEIFNEFVDTMEMKEFMESTIHLFPASQHQQIHILHAHLITLCKQYLLKMTSSECTHFFSITYQFFVFIFGCDERQKLFQSLSIAFPNIERLAEQVSLFQRTIRTIIMEIANATTLHDGQRESNVMQSLPSVTFFIKNHLQMTWNVRGLDDFFSLDFLLFDRQSGIDGRKMYAACTTLKECLNIYLTTLLEGSSTLWKNICMEILQMKLTSDTNASPTDVPVFQDDEIKTNKDLIELLILALFPEPGEDRR